MAVVGVVVDVGWGVGGCGGSGDVGMGCWWVW